jgi:hypothetical protein
MASIIKRWLSVAVASAVLAACGGGGGSGSGSGSGSGGVEMPSAATGRFTTTTYVETTDGVVSVAATSLGSQSLIPLVAAASAGAGPAEAGWDLTGLTRGAARRALQRGTMVQPLARTTYTEPCDSGHIFFVSDYASEHVVSRGDYLEVSFENCVLSGETFSGSARFTVTQYSETSSSASAGFRIAFNAFGSASLRLDGAARIDMVVGSTSELMRLSFLGLSAATPDGTVTWYHQAEWNFNGSSETLTLSGYVQIGEEFYQLVAVSPFVLNAATGYPASGVLRVLDAHGARVEVTATATRFTYTYYAAGATSATEGPVEGPLYADLF